MAAGNATRKLGHLFIFAALSLYLLTSFVYQGRDKQYSCTYGGQNIFYRRDKRRGQPLHFPVVEWGKHGRTTIALPTSNQAYGVDIYILICGDVRPLPGPNSQDANTTQSVSYTAGQLKRLRNSSISKNTLTSDTAFLKKLNLLGILRKNIKVTAKSTGTFLGSPITVRVTPRFNSRRGSRTHFFGSNAGNLVNIRVQNSIFASQNFRRTENNSSNFLKNAINIPTRITARADRLPETIQRTPILRNITCRSALTVTRNKTNKGAILPRFCCLNARSLNKKIDEPAAFMSVNEVHIAAVTESWLTDEVHDDQISIGGYVIYRKDRMQCRGGGVCVYVSQQLPVRRRLDLEDPDLECMWLWTRPPRLPRPVSAVAVCVVYSPPDSSVQEQRVLCDYSCVLD